MVELPARAERVIADIAQVAARPANPAQRAPELLEALRRVTPFEAGFIALWDPDTLRQVPLARDGYSAKVQRFLDSAPFAEDLERVGMRRHLAPVQLADLPVPPQTLPSWADHLYPAGFRECLGVGLFTADGRYQGLVGFNMADPRPASAGACALLLRLAPLVAYAVDPLRGVVALADMVADAVAGVVLTHSGGTLGLPGLAGHQLLAAGSPVLTAARVRLADGQLYVRFLCPPEDPAADAGFVQVTGLACPAGASYLHAVLLLSPPPARHRLTRRELEVLGLLVEGWTNRRIAAALGVAPRTVAAHTEHILFKLGVSSRSMAAVRAVRQGLYIPVELHERPRRP